MLEHLFNCHGEWQAIIAAFSSAPFIGYWAQVKYCEHKEKQNEIENRRLGK